MSLTAVFQRLDGSRVTRTIEFADETCDICLIPARSMLTGEIEETRRYDRTDEIQEGLSVFAQNGEHDPKAGLELFGGRN